MHLVRYTKKINKAIKKINFENLEHIIDRIKQSDMVYTMGNGGSSSTASHFTQDLLKACNKPSICLTDNIAWITAVSNDINFTDVFAKLLETFPRFENPVLIAISTSGNSENIIKAVNMPDFYSIAFTGFDGGELDTWVNSNICVPLNDVRLIESTHSILLHYIIDRLVNDD